MRRRDSIFDSYWQLLNTELEFRTTNSLRWGFDMATDKAPTKEKILEELSKNGINNLEELVVALLPSETGGYYSFADWSEENLDAIRWQKQDAQQLLKHVSKIFGFVDDGIYFSEWQELDAASGVAAGIQLQYASGPDVAGQAVVVEGR